jgi:hypothetical protein
MYGRSIILLLLTAFLSSCGLNPPEWLYGQWKEKNDSLKNEVLWKIDKSGIYSRTYKLGSTIVITRTDILKSDRYIIRTDHAAEKEPYFQIFKRVNKNEILSYDSNTIAPIGEILLVKFNDTKPGSH